MGDLILWYLSLPLWVIGLSYFGVSFIGLNIAVSMDAPRNSPAHVDMRRRQTFWVALVLALGMVGMTLANRMTGGG